MGLWEDDMAGGAWVVMERIVGIQRLAAVVSRAVDWIGMRFSLSLAPDKG